MIFFIVGDSESYGALWTRFTVQYNLFAGSIVALGSDTQRESLYATQHDGQLGCFAFTENGAGICVLLLKEIMNSLHVPLSSF